jgi:TPP-dependent trihydroxycyclohexane-1,2-dione (THcHDO) dehydratase
VESFVQLATLSTTQSQTLAQSVNSALSLYQNTSNLDELKNVLQQQQSNTTVLTAALNQLQNAINAHLNKGGTGPTAQGGTNTAAFQAFIPVLQTLAGNRAVASQASNILGELSRTGSTIAEF